eukprot:COSAG04_NODE_1731_length_5772_cov_2.240437_7_plen_88_part_00
MVNVSPVCGVGLLRFTDVFGQSSATWPVAASGIAEPSASSTAVRTAVSLSRLVTSGDELAADASAARGSSPSTFSSSCGRSGRTEVW